jgi:putative transposase
MKNKKRKSTQEKIDIITEGRELGWVETARKHDISYPTLQNWRNLFASGGEPALSGRLIMSNSEIKKLLHENQKLKELVAEKELEIRIKNEFLKKK